MALEITDFTLTDAESLRLETRRVGSSIRVRVEGTDSLLVFILHNSPRKLMRRVLGARIIQQRRGEDTCYYTYHPNSDYGRNKKIISSNLCQEIVLPLHDYQLELLEAWSQLPPQRQQGVILRGTV